MNAQDLETAVRLQLDLVILVLNDGAYGMIKWKQTHMGFANFGLDFNNPDFVMHAESYGASGHRLQSVSELVPLVQSCFDQRGVHVIDVPVDYSENDRILHDEIQELSSKI
jgi:acetolactate synthase-1/2/3 large subunit